MKKLLFLSLGLYSVSVCAQMPPGMDPAQMQQIMQKMHGVQACMAGIDHSQIEAFQQQAKQVKEEIKALCADGKKPQAQIKALGFFKEMAANKTLQDMRKCTADLPQMMPKMAGLFSEQRGKATGEAHKDICERVQN